MRSRTTIIVTLALVLILAGAIFLYQQKAAVYATLDSLKLIPQPERFTELYFENASNLPHAAVAKQPISFSFGIHNMEATTTVYPYRVYFEYPDGTRADFAAGTVTLADGASTTIAVSHTFPASNPIGKVVVDLPSLDGQRIDFLLPNTN